MYLSPGRFGFLLLPVAFGCLLSETSASKAHGSLLQFLMILHDTTNMSSYEAIFGNITLLYRQNKLQALAITRCLFPK
jgi:hypothetical protein